MLGTSRRRIVAVVVGALVAVVFISGAVYLINGSRGFDGCAGVLGCGWIVPLAAGLIIGAVIWLLSGQTPKYDDEEAHTADPACGSCGSPVRVSWRLCPACGARLRD